MTKPINEYTMDELSAKIKAIKAERERTANALKRYEEELERKKQEVPLGVPLEDKTSAHHLGVYEFGFVSEESQHVFHEWIKGYVEALWEIAKGEPIDIKVLCTLLEKGKVAFCPVARKWFWTNKTPQLLEETWGTLGVCFWIGGFNIKPAENWKTSLMECGL